MRESRGKKRWAQGKPVLATIAHFSDPASAQLIGLLGFDCLWIDLEHQPLGMSQAADMMRAARVSDMDVMARPAKGKFMRMARLLEAGASLIMYPRCESAEEAREMVRWGKFAPLGERGFYSASPDNPYSTMPIKDYVRQANEQTVLMAQIESPNAVKNARAIAEVDASICSSSAPVTSPFSRAFLENSVPRSYRKREADLSPCFGRRQTIWDARARPRICQEHARYRHRCSVTVAICILSARHCWT
jgi:HpcH/HpaI aldolase/citrate lyase family